MLRALHRAPAWNAPEYFCSCCQLRLRAKRQQERGYSSEAASTEIHDDWHSNFNDLYTEPLAGKSEDGERKQNVGAFRRHNPKLDRHMEKETVPESTLELSHREVPEGRKTRRERTKTVTFGKLRDKLDAALTKRDGPSNSEAHCAVSQPFAAPADTIALANLPTTLQRRVPGSSSRTERSISSMTQRHTAMTNAVESDIARSSATEAMPPSVIAAPQSGLTMKDTTPASNDPGQVLESLALKHKGKNASRTVESGTKERKANRASKKDTDEKTSLRNRKSEGEEKKASRTAKSGTKERKANRVSKKDTDELRPSRNRKREGEEEKLRSKESKRDKPHAGSQQDSRSTESSQDQHDADSNKLVRRLKIRLIRHHQSSRRLIRRLKSSPNLIRHTSPVIIGKHLSANPVYSRKVLVHYSEYPSASERGSPGRRRRRLHSRIAKPSGIAARKDSDTISADISPTKRRRTPRSRIAKPSSIAAGRDSDTISVDTSRNELSSALPGRESSGVMSIDPTTLEITPLNLSQPPVPSLQYGLDRALFNPGVFQLQDPHSRVYNFDPYLQKIMPVVEFDFNALKEYKTSSQDTALRDLAKKHEKRYIGSTSSMTATLCHFHYLISAFRPLNLEMLSRSFPDSLDTFTQINRVPNAIFLRYKGDGIYAIDADKEFDGPNVLMMLGKSMEKLLTLPKDDYERYRKENSHSVTEEERTAPEAYEYTTMGSFLMRSQLDAYDPRLPGTGMFDLKTRAVVSVRMNSADHEPMTGYEIQTLQGRFQSYEREYYDMLRSTMLKYMLQVRMGRMEGIFLAYHNVERIFGFQYVPLHEMDRAIHSQTDRCLGDQEFKLSLELLNKVLDKATTKFPDQSLRIHLETSEDKKEDSPAMWIHAEPMFDGDINEIQAASQERIAKFERTMMGIQKNVSDNVAEANTLGIAVNDKDEVKEKDSAPERSQGELAVLPDERISPCKHANASPRMEDEDFATSATDAAPKFFSTDLEKKEDLEPLFSASIVCMSRVNDSAMQRPSRLKSTDKWELQHRLEERETSREMWTRYEDMKSRRKAVFEQLLVEKAEDESEEEGEKKKRGGYVELLKSMSQEGRVLREQMDELDAGKPPVVVGRPLAGERVEEQVESLDDYMAWLYRGGSQEA